LPKEETYRSEKVSTNEVMSTERKYSREEMSSKKYSEENNLFYKNMSEQEIKTKPINALYMSDNIKIKLDLTRMISEFNHKNEKVDSNIIEIHKQILHLLVE